MAKCLFVFCTYPVDTELYISWFSAYALNLLKASKASLFWRKGSTVKNLLKSSMKVIQYWKPSLVRTGRGPCRSEWTSSSRWDGASVLLASQAGLTDGVWLCR